MAAKGARSSSRQGRSRTRSPSRIKRHLQTGLVQPQDRPGAGLRAGHQAVEAEELVRRVRLAAHRAHGADRRRADSGGEAGIGAAAGEFAVGLETACPRGAARRARTAASPSASAPAAGIRRLIVSSALVPGTKLRSMIASIARHRVVAVMRAGRSAGRSRPPAQGATVLTLCPPRTRPTFSVMPRSRSVSAWIAWILRASSSIALMPVGEVAARMRGAAGDRGRP